MSVALLFPPIISSGFGSYYPALAVLAGYLASHDVAVAQFDLNETMAEHLLAPAVLAAAGCGSFVAADPDEVADPRHMAAVAARILLKTRNQLFDADGRHRFGERDQTPAYLLTALAQPYLVDQSVHDTLADLAAGTPLVRWYRDFFLDRLLAINLADDLTLVGISVPMGPQLFPALVLAEAVKALRPDVRIVFGGPTMSLMAEEGIERLLRSRSSLDAVVRYEGETPLLALARQAEAGAWAPEAVTGTSCLVEGQISHRAPGPGIPLDRLPFAKYEPALLDRLDAPELGVVQTRGCYWGRCAYCDFVELYEGSPRYRGRSPASFVDEVEALVTQHGVRRFSLITEAIPPSFALKFSEMILARGLDIRWSSFAMVDRHFSRSHLETMARSGCDHLVIGLETMADRVLNLVHKYASGDDNEHFLREAHAAGISLKVNLIPDLPTTTFGEAIACLDRLEGIADTLESVAVFPFEATRSSQIGRTPERYGIEVEHVEGISGQAAFAENHLRIVDPGMTDNERREVQARYAAFANMINARTHRSAAIASDADGKWQVASSDFDLVRLEDQLQLFHWKTRERWEAPLGFNSIIDRAVGLGPAFSRDDLLAGASARPEELGLLMDYLVEKRIFVAAEAGAPKEAAH